MPSLTNQPFCTGKIHVAACRKYTVSFLHNVCCWLLVQDSKIVGVAQEWNNKTPRACHVSVALIYSHTQYFSYTHFTHTYLNGGTCSLGSVVVH